MRRSAERGFSLIELLMVISVIAIIMAFAVPATSSILKGTKLTQGTQLLVDNFALARQTAISKNRTVEVRLYKYADAESPGGAAGFRGLQAFEVLGANRMLPIEKMKPLPQGIIADSAPELSNILDTAKRTEKTGTDPLVGVGIEYTYMALRFKPDGSTDLSPTGGPWFLTVHDELSGDGLTTPPANFVTVEVDPISGTLKFYRPGL